ncbi:MAG: TonB-dependent receptor [Thermoanaerobaculia bacterium]|nr:TonB-dependent receptor [Thermoanaerobaculia bacterium]
MSHTRCKLVVVLLSLVMLGGPTADAQVTSSAVKVTGRVLDAVGQPLAEAAVFIEPGGVARATTDAEGTFEVQLSPGSYRVRASLTGYRSVTADLVVEAGQEPLVSLTMAAETRILGEIDVTASYAIDRAEPVATAALSGKEILELPNFGNDLLRAVAAIPGVTANDASAQFNVRGGLYRDTSIRIDGLEIFEPYHLKDFQGVFSIIDPEVIGSLELIPGGFPVEYGDKMAGVLNMATARPGAAFGGRLGVSISSAWAAAYGAFGAEDESRWQVSGRRGYLDLILGLVGDDDEESSGSGPQYWDLIGKIDHPLTQSQTMTFNVLASDDSLEESEAEVDDFGFPERDSIDSDYGNSYLWLTHQGILGHRMFVDTRLSGGRVDRDRVAVEESFGLTSEIRDIRKMDVFDLRQDWNAELSDRHYLKWGFEARTYDVDYDYTNDFALDGFLGSGGLTRFVDSFSSESYSAYLADRFRIRPSLVLELGARYDRQTLTDEDQLSPRLNLVYDLKGGGILRAAWGQYYQSQRPNELQVEDGETSFFPVEQAETLLVGWERGFGSYNLRFDAYNREITDPRPYYGNLFEALSPNPEATRDRILVEPESSTARGVELFLSRRGGARFDWWASYTWSEVTDRINGRDVPRSYDQTHAVSLSGNYRINDKWTIQAIFNYHTGWPTTSVSGRAVEGPGGEIFIEPVVGALNAERLDDYHRLDVRVSRLAELSNGKSLELFLDVQNLYDQSNQAGFVVDERNFLLLPSGEVEYRPLEEEWLGILPSFGVGLRF